MDFHHWWAIFAGQPAPMFCTALALIAAFLMGFSRSGIGAGGFVVSPLMVLALGPTVGVAVVAVLMLPAAFTGYLQHRREAKPETLYPLLLGAIVGTLVGGLLLWRLAASGELALLHRRLEIVVALLSLIYVVLVVLRQKIADAVGAVGQPTARGLFLTASAIGGSQTLANSGSPLLTIYFLCYGVGKEHFVGAQVGFLLVQNLLKLIPLVLLGILHFGNATVALVLMPLTFAGSWLGQRFYRHANEKMFFGLYALLLVIGFVASVALLVGRVSLLNHLV